MSLNACTISGNLGASSEVRYTQGGTPVLSCSVAVNERRRQSDGNYVDETSWFDCVMFGKRAEALEPYLQKGTKISIVGHLRKRTWEKYGQQYSKVEIIIDELELMNARREKQASKPADAASAVYDEDIPF